MSAPYSPDWNAFSRRQASERWRVQSAAMGKALTELIADEARVERRMRVLDVASGTGEPAITIATRLAGSGLVCATDLAPEPLKTAKARAAQRRLTNFSIQQADAQALPFVNDSFARVTCRLGVMFFPRCDVAFREIHRVLKTGGRFTLVAWGPRDDARFAQPYFETTISTIQRILPDLEAPQSGKNMFRFADPDTTVRALRAAGFAQADAKLRTVPWTWPGTPAELWDYFQSVTVPWAPMLNAIPADRKAEVDAAVLAEMARHSDGSAVQLRATFTLASAHK